MEAIIIRTSDFDGLLRRLKAEIGLWMKEHQSAQLLKPVPFPADSDIKYYPVSVQEQVERLINRFEHSVKVL